jgi:ArsR family transcriptional regulator
MNQEEVMRVLQSLSDPVRLDIVYLLGREGPMNVNRIASNFRISRPAISHHLKVLRSAKIVSATKNGQEVENQFEGEHVVAWLREIADQLEACCA